MRGTGAVPGSLACWLAGLAGWGEGRWEVGGRRVFRKRCVEAVFGSKRVHLPAAVAATSRRGERWGG